MGTPVTDQGDKSDCTAVKTVRHSIRYWTVFFLFAIPLLFSFWVFNYAVSPGPLQAEGGVAVLIPRKSAFSSIENILVQNEVIQADLRFRLLARVTGKGRVLKAGEYFFQSRISPYRVLVLLESGKAVLHPVTIPEGVSLEKIAEIFAVDNWVDKERFLTLARQQETVQKYGLAGNSLEGYLFPDTYYLSREEQDEESIIHMMVKRFEEVYQEIGAGEKNFFSQHDLVTIASIVEKEAAKADERPMIARVFINRLQKGMRLQADPTVLYGGKGNTGKITRKDLATPTPYNTYVIEGLPPGPICSPGRDSLLAVMHPAAGDYLYFVSRNDGTHYFSKTLAEHNQAVQTFQR